MFDGDETCVRFASTCDIRNRLLSRNRGEEHGVGAPTGTDVSHILGEDTHQSTHACKQQYVRCPAILLGAP